MTAAKRQYLEACAMRWSWPELSNAFSNWHAFEAMRDDLLDAMRKFRANPQMEDLSGKAHNPSGRLTDLLWTMQKAWQPDPACLRPFLDFCDHYQKVFLRRGLVIYCSMLLRELEPVPAPGEPLLL